MSGHDVDDDADEGEAGAAGMDDSGDGSRDERRSPIILKVEYKRLNTFFYDYTKNISKGGTFIKTDRPLEVGTLFRFHLTVPVSSDPIELRGEVRWVVRPAEQAAPAAEGGGAQVAAAPAAAVTGQEPGMGIRFVYADAEERMRLERTVEQMMVKSLGQVAYSRLFAHHTGTGGDAPSESEGDDG